jgi:hypothetical protein
MIYEQQHVHGTQVVLWGDPKGSGEVFIVQSIKDALALWSLLSKKPGVLVISAPNPDELLLLFRSKSSNKLLKTESSRASDF